MEALNFQSFRLVFAAQNRPQSLVVQCTRAQVFYLRAHLCAGIESLTTPNALVGHIQDGHQVLYRKHIMAPTKNLV